MNPQLTFFLARERQREIVAAADRRRYLNSPRVPFRGPIVVRIATARDRSSLENLAALDSTEVLEGATLIGELRERPVAALSLSDSALAATRPQVGFVTAPR